MKFVDVVLTKALVWGDADKQGFITELYLAPVIITSNTQC